MIAMMRFFQPKRTLPGIRAFLSLFALVCALFPVLGQAQVTYTGAAGTENFSSQAIASTSQPHALSFQVAAETSIGSIAVLTTGVAGLDFGATSAGTCAPKTYAAAATCTVDVTFTALGAGMRMGAVVFFAGADGSGVILGIVPVYGIGTGPQISFGPGITRLIDPKVNGSLLVDPVAVALDAAGNLFLADLFSVVELPADGSTPLLVNPTVNGLAIDYPSGVAIDGAGDLYISDFMHNRIVKVPVGGGAPSAITATVNGKALNGPYGVAVDAQGDLFIADEVNRRVVEIPASGAAAIAIAPAVAGKALDSPQGVAVDGSGNLFIADTLNRRVVEVPVSGAAVAIDPSVNGLSLSYTYSVGLDAAGDLFIADTCNNRVVEVPADGAAPVVFDPKINTKSLQYPKGIAVDGAGDVYIADASNSRIIEIQRSVPPTLTFATPTVLGTADDSDGPQTAQIINLGNQPLNLSALTYPADFSESGADAATCTSTSSLAPGQQCDLPIEFTPQHSGPLNEFVTLLSNTRNGNQISQWIATSGTSLASPAALSAPRPGSTLAGGAVTFTWSEGVGVASYQLLLGTAGAGSSNLYISSPSLLTSITVPAIPAVGVPVYARLISNIGGVAQHADYTFVESCTPAAMTSPTPGATLTGSSVTFSWTAGGGVTAYELWLGTSGPGASALYNSGSITATSVSLTKLPTSGVTIYARLYSMILGSWKYSDYTFIEK